MKYALEVQRVNFNTDIEAGRDRGSRDDLHYFICGHLYFYSLAMN